MAFRLVAVVPRLRVAHVAVHTHQGEIHAGLYPSQHPLYVVLVVVLVSGSEEPAGIIGPPGNAGSLQSQSCRDLSAEGLPVVAHVARPQCSTIALNARESAARQYHGPLLRLVLAQSLIHRLAHQQRVDVAHAVAVYLSVGHASASQVVVLRLRGILPPCVDAQWQQPLAEVLPVGLGGPGVEEVYPVRLWDVETLSLHLAPHLRVLVYLRPNAEHQSDVHLVETVGEQAWSRVVGLVELHGVPSVTTPVLPVLHDDVDGQPFLSEALCCRQYLVLRVEALAAMDVSQCPLRHERRLARQFSVGGHDFIGRSHEHRVVHGLADGRA